MRMIGAWKEKTKFINSMGMRMGLPKGGKWRKIQRERNIIRKPFHSLAGKERNEDS